MGDHHARFVPGATRSFTLTCSSRQIERNSSAQILTFVLSPQDDAGTLFTCPVDSPGLTTSGRHTAIGPNKTMNFGAKKSHLGRVKWYYRGWLSEIRNVANGRTPIGYRLGVAF